jgi:hypothetical protein
MGGIFRLIEGNPEQRLTQICGVEATLAWSGGLTIGFVALTGFAGT